MSFIWMGSLKSISVMGKRYLRVIYLMSGFTRCLRIRIAGEVRLDVLKHVGRVSIK